MRAFLFVMAGTGLCLAQTTPPVIDGRLDDPFWAKVPRQKLIAASSGVTEDGGEVRIQVRGRYLLIGAELPERSGRITARMIGRHPNWEDEDLLRIVAGPDIGYTDRMVKINPLGAYSVEREGQVVYANSERYMVATSIGERGWTVEFAFPLNEVSAPGPSTVRASVERIRAARPDAPQLRWRWPASDPSAGVGVDASARWEESPPAFKPALFDQDAAPLMVGRRSIPPAGAGWNSEGWRDVPVWPLLRQEARPRAARLSSEVKAVHDGRTISFFARFEEPGETVSGVREHDGRVEQDDSFQVLLSGTGSSYVHLAVNPAGYFLDLAGKTGGPRISRPRADWDSGAQIGVTRESGVWTTRMDIPIDRVATILGENPATPEFRVLLMRNRAGRESEPRESAQLPVVLGETTFNPARYRRMILAAEPTVPIPPIPPRRLGPFDSLDPTVLPAAERKQRKVSQMLDMQLRRRVITVLEAESEEWSKIESRAGWERFRDQRLNRLREFIGAMPERVPLQMQTGKEYRGQGYRRFDIVYRSRPGLWITANLYVPETSRGKSPALIIIPSHHRPRWQAELQDMGILWSRAGAVVLVPDNLGHGERIQTYPWNREGYHARYNLGLQLYAAGESLIKWMVWDTMRGVDLVLERSDVDPERIVLLGAVAGGGDPAAITAALDPRIAAVAPFNFGEARPRSSGRGRWPGELADPGWGSWESTRNVPLSISGQFFPWTICAAVAPRRFIYSYEMGWDVEQQPAWRRYQRVFSFYGVPGNLDEAHGFGGFPGPGECSNIGPSQRKTFYPELQRWFGIAPPAVEPNDRRPESELMSLTPELASRMGIRLAHEVARDTAIEKLRAVRAKLAAMDRPSRMDWLRGEWRKRLGDIDPGAPPVVTSKWKKNIAGASAEAIALEFDGGIIVPMLLLRPATGPVRPPVVVAVSQGGKERLLGDNGEVIQDLLQRGIAVCLPDVRGTGETSPDTRRGPLSGEITLAATELMMGSSLLGARLKDLRTVIAYLTTRTDVDSGRVALWGDSHVPANPDRLLLDETPGWQMGPWTQYQVEPLGGLLAMLASLYEPRVKAVAIRNGVSDVASILDERFAYVPGDVIVPGMLEAGDLTDVVAAGAPRPVLLEAMRDCRNRLVAEPVLRTRFGAALEAYGAAAAGSLTIRSRESGPAELAEWIGRRF